MATAPTREQPGQRRQRQPGRHHHSPIDPKARPSSRTMAAPPQTWPCSPASPAIDKGANAFIPAGNHPDQRGFIRLANVTVDHRGVRVRGPRRLAPRRWSPAPADGTDYAPGALTLRQAVSLADAANAPASAPQRPDHLFLLRLRLLAPDHHALPGAIGADAGGDHPHRPGADLLTISGNTRQHASSRWTPRVTAAASGLTISGGQHRRGPTAARRLQRRNPHPHGTRPHRRQRRLRRAPPTTHPAPPSRSPTAPSPATSAAPPTALNTGGVANLGALTVVNCTFTADSGAIANSGTLSVYDSTISGNSAYSGAGHLHHPARLPLQHHRRRQHQHLPPLAAATFTPTPFFSSNHGSFSGIQQLHRRRHRPEQPDQRHQLQPVGTAPHASTRCSAPWPARLAPTQTMAP